MFEDLVHQTIERQCSQQRCGLHTRTSMSSFNVECAGDVDYGALLLENPLAENVKTEEDLCRVECVTRKLSASAPKASSRIRLAWLPSVAFFAKCSA